MTDEEETHGLLGSQPTSARSENDQYGDLGGVTESDAACNLCIGSACLGVGCFQLVVAATWRCTAGSLYLFERRMG